METGIPIFWFGSKNERLAMFHPGVEIYCTVIHSAPAANGVQDFVHNMYPHVAHVSFFFSFVNKYWVNLFLTVCGLLLYTFQLMWSKMTTEGIRWKW